jgi:hypothetical protein
MASRADYSSLKNTLSRFLNPEQISLVTRHLAQLGNAIFVFEAAGGADDDVAARFIFSRNKLTPVIAELREELSYAANAGQTADAATMLDQLEELCSDGLTQFQKAYEREYDGLTGRARTVTLRRAVRMVKMVLKGLSADRRVIVVLD